MPKSKRAKVVHLTQVAKKGRDHKEKQFESVREAVGQYQHCFAFAIENSRNVHLQKVRHELSDDSRMFFGKTKLTIKALGTTPEEAYAPGIEELTPHLKGEVGLLFTNRDPESVLTYFQSLSEPGFARSGATASREFVIPPGIVYSTGGEVPLEHDIPMEHSIEPELRKLGMPTRMVRGKIVLGDENGIGEGYTVCKEGDVLDSRQARLLKLFSVLMSEFKIRALAYWSAETGSVTEVDQDGMEE